MPSVAPAGGQGLLPAAPSRKHRVFGFQQGYDRFAEGVIGHFHGVESNVEIVRGFALFFKMPDDVIPPLLIRSADQRFGFFIRKLSEGGDAGDPVIEGT